MWGEFGVIFKVLKVEDECCSCLLLSGARCDRVQKQIRINGLGPDLRRSFGEGTLPSSWGC